MDNKFQEEKFDRDNKTMVLGVEKLLGRVPYDARPVAPAHTCESDGNVYSEKDNKVYVTLCCIHCGNHWDKPI